MAENDYEFSERPGYLNKNHCSVLFSILYSLFFALFSKIIKKNNKL